MNGGHPQKKNLAVGYQTFDQCSTAQTRHLIASIQNMPLQLIHMKLLKTRYYPKRSTGNVVKVRIVRDSEGKVKRVLSSGRPLPKTRRLHKTRGEAQRALQRPR